MVVIRSVLVMFIFSSFANLLLAHAMYSHHWLYCSARLRNSRDYAVRTVDIASALNLLIKFFVDAHLHSSVVNFENVTVKNWEKSPQPVSCIRGDGGNQPLATIVSIDIAAFIQ